MQHPDPAPLPRGTRVLSAFIRADQRFRYMAMALLLSLGLFGCGGIPGYGSPGPLSRNGASSGAEGKVIPITPELIRAQAVKRTTGVPADVLSLFTKAPVYTIGPGDVVGIIVYDHPELLPNAGAVIAQQTDPTGVTVAPGFIVDAAGEISFPYIGRTKLQGLTETGASELISRRIGAYIKKPQVTVRIQSFRSQRAYVEGEVRTPGIQIFTDLPMTLSEAINRAGSITPIGDRSRVTLTRRDRTVLIDLPMLQRLGVDGTRIPLQNGDIVNVGTRDDSRVYVMGEIQRPSGLLMRNGRLSLNEALGDAGGLDHATSSPGQIYVVRNSSEDPDRQEIYNLDARNPVALALADRFELKPRDVIYVDHVPLVSWSRVFSLILPAAQVVNLVRDTARR